MKTTELKGAALDWAVAKCEGIDTFPYALPGGFALYTPSSSWKDGGPIIERMGIDIKSKFGRDTKECFAHTRVEGARWVQGDTPLEAAMRSYVLCRLGSDVEIPEGLL